MTVSARIKDQNGYLEIKGNPLTKAGVYPYTRREIGQGDSDEIVMVYRPADEIAKAANSFKLMPLIDDHAWLGGDGDITGMAPEQKGVLGTIGEEVFFEEPYLKGNIRIFADHAKALIDAGKIELSAGYRCTWSPEAGEYNGKKYQFTQRNIRANHIALVDQGRSGPDVAVLDHHFTFAVDTASEVLRMDLQAILAALAALSEEEKEQLRAALAGDPEATTDETDETDEVEEKEVPTEAAIKANDAAEELVEVAAEEDADKASEKVAEIEEKIEDIKEALSMDSIVKIIGERDKLAKALIPHIGAFSYDSMTKEDVAKYGLKKLGIKTSGDAVVALDAALQVRVADSRKAVAKDTAPRRHKFDRNDFYTEAK